MASGSVIVWESAVRGAQPWQALDRSCNGWRLCRLLLQLVLLRGDQSNVPRGCCRGLLGLPGQFSSSQSRSSQEPAASLARIPDLCTDHIFIIPSSRAEKCRTTPHTYTHTHTHGYTHHCTHIQKPHRASLDSECWEVTQGGLPSPRLGRKPTLMQKGLWIPF